MEKPKKKNAKKIVGKVLITTNEFNRLRDEVRGYNLACKRWQTYHNHILSKLPKYIEKILSLTNVIRNNAECDLDYGTLRTLKMIDDEANEIQRIEEIK